MRDSLRRLLFAVVIVALAVAVWRERGAEIDEPASTEKETAASADPPPEAAPPDSDLRTLLESYRAESETCAGETATAQHFRRAATDLSGHRDRPDPALRQL